MSFIRKRASAEIWQKPLIAHPDDDEFDSSQMNGAWQWYVNGSGNIAMPGSNFNTYGNIGSAARADLNNQRKSWLVLQSGYPGANILILNKPIRPLGTNALFYARMSTRLYTAASTNNDYQSTFGLYDESGGNPVGNNSVRVYPNESDAGTRQIQMDRNDNGVFAVIGNTTDTTSKPVTCEYVAIHKVGNNYHTWASASGSSWVWMGSTTLTAVPTRLCLLAGGEINNQPGSFTFGIDFVRRIDTDQFFL